MVTKTLFKQEKFSFEYLEKIVELLNLAERRISGHDFCTVEELRAELTFPGYDLETDVALFFTQDGLLVGYADFWGAAEPRVRQFGFGRVHPDYLGQGLGTQIMEWLDARGNKNVPLAPESARVVMHVRALSSDQITQDLFKNCGFSHVRSSYRMKIDFTSQPEEPEDPEGITIRAVGKLEEDIRKAIWVDYEAFQDHWGVVPEPFEPFYQRFKHWIDNEPNIDLSACYLAMDGDSPVGMCINSLTTTEYPDSGWVNSLGVLRDYRKRGIGLALLKTSFAEFYRRGRKQAGLGVDTENLTGALRLYEQAGMVVDREYHLYEKELRPGEDLMKH